MNDLIITDKKDVLGEYIAEGDIVLVENHEEFENSAFVVFIHNNQWVVSPLFDVHMDSREGLNGIRFAEGTSGFDSLGHMLEEHEVKIFGNVFDVREFAYYIERK
ncbi:MAG TPA: hypothetical protein VFC62_04070 [Atopostipes sp.]|nr:hypothetical protein [Atopostipes sp.]